MICHGVREAATRASKMSGRRHDSELMLLSPISSSIRLPFVRIWYAGHQYDDYKQEKRHHREHNLLYPEQKGLNLPSISYLIQVPIPVFTVWEVLTEAENSQLVSMWSIFIAAANLQRQIFSCLHCEKQNILISRYKTFPLCWIPTLFNSKTVWNPALLLI